MSNASVLNDKRIMTLTIITLFLLTGAKFVDEPQPCDQQNKAMVTYQDLKGAAFLILDTKCNVCHKRQNPFMVFSMKNMEKRAPKIQNQVFCQTKNAQRE